MKQTSKLFGTMLLAAALTTSCVDDDKLQYSFEKPASIEGMEYLAEYGSLTDYKAGNSKLSPDFKLGGALAATDYNADGIWTRLFNANFDEIVAGNEMKMASCVNDKGEMDFGTVQTFVSNAEANGKSVYGHTLAWHSQQPVKWLNSLIAGREIEIDPDAAVEKQDYFIDYTTFSSFPFYVMGYAPEFSPEEGLISLSDAGWYQYFAADGMGLSSGKKYKVTCTVKSPVDASIKVVFRWDWGSGMMEGDLDIKNTDGEFKEFSVQFDTFGGENGFIVFQLAGLANQRICIKDLKVSHSEAAGPAEWWTNKISNSSLDDGENKNVVGREKGKPDFYDVTPGAGVDGTNALVVHSVDAPDASWDTQFFVYTPDFNWEKGMKYQFKMKIRADKPATISTQAHAAPGAYIHWDMLGSISVTTDWQEFKKEGTISADQSGDGRMQSIAFNLNELTEANTYYIDNVEWSLKESGNVIPLTPEEKKDTLTWAMEQWISGMMAACDGKVKAWDVVNEAISGGEEHDSEGVFALQHAAAGDKTNFFWQDYLGDLDYVRTAVRLAREYGPEGLTLFINDYNLESDWDDNGKLKSLIKWIERWEADGVTKIDGIGTQMHLKYYTNADIQASKEAHIVEMFKLMAASGKKVRVSELDIEFADAEGNNVEVANMSDEQLRTVAAFYKWLIEQYQTLIPTAQQWGFCIWTPIDASPATSWTHQQLYGLWDQNLYRTHAYGSFADGLAGK